MSRSSTVAYCVLEFWPVLTVGHLSTRQCCIGTLWYWLQLKLLVCARSRYQGNDSIAEEQGEDAFYPGNTKRTTALVAKSEVARGFMVHPALLALADTYLGPSCNQVQLSVCSALNIGPGARSQRLHREDGPYPSAMKHVLPGSDLVLWSMWAITEFTQENGATLVVPGSREDVAVALDSRQFTCCLPVLSHSPCRDHT